MRSSILENEVNLWFTPQDLSLVSVITGNRTSVGRPLQSQEFTQTETAYVRPFFRVKIIFNNFQHVLTTSAPILGQSEKKEKRRRMKEELLGKNKPAIQK